MADNPPFAHEGRLPGVVANEIVAAWQADPWPYVFEGRQGRLQPYAPQRLPPSITAVPVNNPPFGHLGRDTWTIYETVAIGQPDPWAYVAWSYTFEGRQGRLQPYAPQRLPPSIMAVRVDNPPLGHLGRDVVSITQAAWAAQPPDPLPTLIGKRSPGIPGQSIDNPPVLPEGRSAWFASLASWQPPDPLPTLIGKLSPAIPGQSVDNPPGLLPRTVAYPVDVSFIQPLRYVPQVAAPQVAASPYPNFWLAPILQTWQPADQAPILPRNLSPGIPGQSVDKPPLINETIITIGEIVALWQPPDPPPVQRGPLAPGIPGQSVDNPPVISEGRSNWLPSLLAQWQPTDPPAPLSGKFSSGVPGQSIDNPPFINEGRQIIGDSQWQTPTTTAWFLPDPLPTLPGKLSPGIPGQSVDAPPLLGQSQAVFQSIITTLNQPLPQPQSTVSTTVQVLVSFAVYEELNIGIGLGLPT